MDLGLTLSYNENDNKDFSGNSLYKSGMHLVSIKYVIIKETKNGSKTLDMQVEKDGLEYTIYQAFNLNNNNGSPNEIGRKNLNKLMVVLGFPTVPKNIKEVNIPLGKDKVVTPCMCIMDFCGLEVLLHLKKRYGYYNGKVTEKMVIHNIFSSKTLASANEICKDREGKDVVFGKQYNMELEFSDNDMLDKNVTQDMVDDHINSKQSRKESSEFFDEIGGFESKFDM